MSRRSFLVSSSAALGGSAILPQLHAATTPPAPAIRIGARVVGLPQARETGIEGIEPGVGGPAERQEIANPNVLQRYRAKMKSVQVYDDVSVFTIPPPGSHRTEPGDCVLDSTPDDAL